MTGLTANVMQWKRMWQLTSGIHYETPNKTVQEKLFEVSTELQDGLLQYRKNTASSSEKLEKNLIQNKQEKLLSFTKRLQQHLELDAIQTWDILCYYFINEYKGSANLLSNYISTESNMTKLLDDIWHYYSLERMIVLKIIKNIIEFSDQSKHPYSNEYTFILNKIGITKFRKSLIEQFEDLVQENPASKNSIGEYINREYKLVSWSERRAREMIEILQILILIINLDGIVPSELMKLMNLFKLHAFGRQHEYFDTTNYNHSELTRKLCYSEIGLLLVTMNHKKISEEWRNETIKLMDSQILGLYQNEEHGPILLIWMLFNFNCSDIDDSLSKKYRQFGTKAVQLNVFDFLHKIILHPMFSDLTNRTSVIVRYSIYEHLNNLCSLFDGDGSVGNHFKIYELFSELLRTPIIGLEFTQNENIPIHSLYSSAIENFPINFIPLSLIGSSLILSGDEQYNYIKMQLQNLPVYTEVYDLKKFDLRPSQQEDAFYVNRPYRPYKEIDFIIPNGTSCIILDKKFNNTYVHFDIKFNYFNALYNEINELFEETLQIIELNEKRLERLKCGLELLMNILKKTQHPNEITTEMVCPIEMIFDIFIKFKSLQNPPINLLAACLNICANLLPLFKDEILTRITKLKILPMISNETLNFKNCSNGISFDSNLVGSYLITHERNLGKYNFLLSYFNFLNISLKLNIYTIELSGLVFLLREIFPNIHSWRFNNEKDRESIYIQTMQYFFDILQYNTTIDHDDNNKEIKELILNTCIYSLLNIDNGMILLKFIGIGNSYLTSVTENETNWLITSNSGLNLIVQLSMTILMLILRLKKRVFSNSDENKKLPLESAIYMQAKNPDTLHIIPIITSYMGNIFNRRLPVLSCRLLRRFGIEFEISLLACLGMEPDQIRLTFLQRLRDELENDVLKISVLEFVEACIDKQYGVTEAFFRINTNNKRKLLFDNKTTKNQPKNLTDGILTYMEEYLIAIENDPKRIASPLLSQILSLFHSLWKNNMTLLIKYLIDKEKFWSSLCKPLFYEINPKLKAYSQLFNILGIEIFKISENNKIDNELKKVLDEFLSDKHFSEWLNVIFNFPQNSLHISNNNNTIIDETPEWLGRLQSFKDLIIIILRKKSHTIQISDENIKLLIDICFDKLIERITFDYETDMRPCVIISELLLIVLVDLKYLSLNYIETDNDIDEPKEILSKISKFLNYLSISYQDIHRRARDSFLSIGIKVCDLIEINDIRFNEEILNIIKSVVEMILIEITEIERNTMQFKLNNYSLILSINLLKKIILQIDGENNLPNWDRSLIENKIFNRLCSCLSVILQIYEYKNISIELLDLIIILSKSTCSNELLHVDIGDYLFLKLLPPKELLTSSNASSKQIQTKWQTQDWWPIYSNGIEIVTILLKKHKHIFIKDALMFVGIHEEYLVDSILLAKQTLETKAINLIKHTMEFIYEMVSYEKLWRCEHGQSMFNLLRCVQVIMDHSVSLLYRPNILKRLLDGPKLMTSSASNNFEQNNALPSNDIIIGMNELIEFIILATKSLLVFSPKLQNLICDSEFIPSQWHPLIEIQFGAPKLNTEPFPQLTFGTVLSAVCIFVKVLNLQHYEFNETILNELSSKYNPNGFSETDSTTNMLNQSAKEKSRNTSSKHSSRAIYAKSHSVTSNSATIPSNEFLTNLDSRMCILALEHVTTLLASQSLLALKDISLSNREKQLIRRELFTELSIFHDFVKKKILTESKEILYRKKYGCRPMKCRNEDQERDNIVEDSELGQTPKTTHNQDNRNSMRVQVVRKLHLEHAHQSTSKTTKRPISHDNNSISKLQKSNDNFEEQILSGQSFIKLVEEDFFHILSIIFSTLSHFDD